MDKGERYTQQEMLDAESRHDIYDKEYQAICIASQRTGITKDEARKLADTMPDVGVANALDWFALQGLGREGVSAQTKIKMYNVLGEMRDEIMKEYGCSAVSAIGIRNEALGIGKPEENRQDLSFTESVESIKDDAPQVVQ